VLAVARGRLITIEGIDGAGKTTLAAGLVQALGVGVGVGAGLAQAPGADAQQEGRDSPPRVELLREPGGVELSERIRTLVKDPTLQVGARAEALLYAAARAQLVPERLLPLLDAGATVLLDRFVDSSLAYQGAARGLGIEAVARVNELATGGLVPDRTLLLRVDPATGRARQGARAHAPDRLEREGEEFFAAIAAAYDELAHREPQRIVVLDASQPPEQVLRAALAAVADLFG
jgi:dTMP kinase